MIYPEIGHYTGVAAGSWSLESSARMTGKKKSPIEKQESDLHLRSTREVTGYRIQAIDGSIGHVEGFIVDCETWSIRYVG